MLGDFITRCLILLFGYAYPAFECYKTVEKNRVQIEQLRFWCQYWIIVAILTVLEKIGDIFISWLPMYHELKLALFVYLWYPKTKGTGYVYDYVLRPYVAKHETNIDRKILEWRARAWDLAIFYWQNCAQLGQSAFFQKTDEHSPSAIWQKTDEHSPSPIQQPESPLFHRQTNKPTNLSNVNKKLPPSAPPPPSIIINHSISETPKSEKVQVHIESRIENLQVQEYSIPDPVTKHGQGTTNSTDNNHLNEKLNQARARLRRSRPHNP
ncbi:HVA22-like protein [Quillaja saponaria]|uniref:HVA22-like protein n=1 Tax=Quillaja saponaria TaxID=32244 RepID=A0AAD7KMZ7_QUISA|nr:HVA22-like protein [Quillaja saponaria]